MKMLEVISFFVAMILVKIVLEVIKSKKITQPIYGDALEGHQQKNGTPTMGGLGFIISIIIMITIVALKTTAILSSAYLGSMIILCGYGYIGFRDDYLKVTKKNNQSGLTPIQKLILQFIISVLLMVVLFVYNTSTIVNFYFFTIDFHIMYYIIIPIMIVGFSNATNLTDGLDGLLTSITIIIFITLYYLGLQSNIELVRQISLIVSGALLGFFVFNKYPAKIFMGDTGSLPLGALFAFICILLKIEVLAFFIGFIYIVEALSVTLQVGYFKYTKKKSGIGKRIFLVAPIHHHLEKKGLSEVEIVSIAICIQIIILIIIVLN